MADGAASERLDLDALERLVLSPFMPFSIFE